MERRFTSTTVRIIVKLYHFYTSLSAAARKPKPGAQILRGLEIRMHCIESLVSKRVTASPISAWECAGAIE
jgi:hypothetical protein